MTRRWVLPAGTALAVLVMPAPAAGQPEATHVDTRLAYTCELPAGPVPVDVRVTAELPPSVEVHEPIQPSSVALSLTLPPPDLAAAASVTAVARLETAIVQQDTATATWSGALSDPVPVADPLVLDLPVDGPPPVVLTAPGEAVLAAAGLTVTLTGYQADGSATDPPSTELTCVAAEDQATRLAAVAVVEATTEPVPGEEQQPPPPGAVVVGPERRADPSPGAQLVELPADCKAIDPPPEQPSSVRYCAYMTGFANVAKLDASIEQPHGLVNVAPTNIIRNCVPGTNLLCQYANIVPNLNGEPKLPEMSGAFLAFGFVPTEAKLQLTQLGVTFADITLDTSPGNPRSLAKVSGKFMARVYDASVNGVPLDLGPNCQTKEPLVIELEGRPPYTLTNGGLLQGMTTIPPFDGCGVTEDLDPILTGLVSGPGNYVRMTQGPLCPLTGSPRFCPPQQPDPL